MTKQELYDYAVSLLVKKNYSSGNMKRQLAKLAEKIGDVEHVLHRLTDNNYLNDAEFITYLFNKHIKKSHGPTRIKQEIRQKRFPQTLTEQEVEKGNIDWYVLAKEARVRKFGETLQSDSKEKNKQIRYLQYKGYTMEMIFEALS
ncbi:MAG TPA: regulatory protein RecX [Arsenophonus sp.]